MINDINAMETKINNLQSFPQLVEQNKLTKKSSSRL